jgi:hypothetical protein
MHVSISYFLFSFFVRYFFVIFFSLLDSTVITYGSFLPFTLFKVFFYYFPCELAFLAATDQPISSQKRDNFQLIHDEDIPARSS